VVVALPRRWRVVERGHVAVTDGERSWVGTGTLVTEHGAERVTLDDAGIIGACLFPGRLLGSLRFGEPEAGEIAGRSCWVVEAGPRRFAGDDGRATTLPPEQFGGVEHRFWFDAATGIVLRHEGAVDGRLWATVELTDLRFDRPIPPDEFAPPPGAIVRSHHELLRDHLVSVGVDPDTVDLDDPAEVRDALRAGVALDAPATRESRTDAQDTVPPGPEDPRAARLAIQAAIEHVAEPDGTGGLPNVQAGSGLWAVYQEARARVAGQPSEISLVLDDCLFLSADRAVVWYSVLLDGRLPPAVRAREGYAVRIGDRWVLERASFADLVGLAGVRCPPPAV